MKYFLDTEFHEYQKKPLFGKSTDTIELISIGIVSEDYQDKIPYGGTIKDLEESIKSKEYYAICKEFDLKAAWKDEWLKENVLKPIFLDLNEKYLKGKILCLEDHGYLIAEGISEEEVTFSYNRLRKLLNKYGKTKKQITEEIKKFIGVKYECDKFGEPVEVYKEKDVFYGYYNSTDWVLFYRLFDTKMLNMPERIDWCCRELQQLVTEVFKVDDAILDYIQACRDTRGFPSLEELKYVFNFKAKEHNDYPKQTNEHNALDDAKWNKKLYEFLNKV